MRSCASAHEHVLQRHAERLRGSPGRPTPRSRRCAAGGPACRCRRGSGRRRWTWPRGTSGTSTSGWPHSTVLSHIEPVQTPWAPSAQRGGDLTAAADAAGGEDRARPTASTTSGTSTMVAIVAAVATGLGALRDDDVDVVGDLLEGVVLAPDERGDLDAGLVGLVDDVLRRRAEGVDDELDVRAVERDGRPARGPRCRSRTAGRGPARRPRAAAGRRAWSSTDSTKSLCSCGIISSSISCISPTSMPATARVLAGMTTSTPYGRPPMLASM